MTTLKNLHGTAGTSFGLRVNLGAASGWWVWVLWVWVFRVWALWFWVLCLVSLWFGSLEANGTGHGTARHSVHKLIP